MEKNKSGLRDPSAYRRAVVADVEREFGDKLRTLIATWPLAPAETIAGAALGEPVSLQRYAQPACFRCDGTGWVERNGGGGVVPCHECSRPLRVVS